MQAPALSRLGLFRAGPLSVVECPVTVLNLSLKGRICVFTLLLLTAVPPPLVWISGCAAINDGQFVLSGGRGLGCWPLVLYLQKLLIAIFPLDFRYRKQKEPVKGKGTELRLRSRLSPSPRKSQGRPDFRNGFFLEHSDSSPVQEELEKPSGKRKCKTKHLAGICDEGKVWLGLMRGARMGRRERRGLLLVCHGNMCQGVVFLSFPG